MINTNMVRMGDKVKNYQDHEQGIILRHLGSGRYLLLANAIVTGGHSVTIEGPYATIQVWFEDNYEDLDMLECAVQCMDERGYDTAMFGINGTFMYATNSSRCMAV